MPRTRQDLSVTVAELRTMLYGLPADMPVEFSIISRAWLGTEGAMRAGIERSFYSDGGFAEPDILARI